LTYLGLTEMHYGCSNLLPLIRFFSPATQVIFQQPRTIHFPPLPRTPSKANDDKVDLYYSLPVGKLSRHEQMEVGRAFGRGCWRGFSWSDDV